MERTIRINQPGPGGSLGECILCGEAFVYEIIMGKSVKQLKIGDGIAPAHEKCCDKYIKDEVIDCTMLPEKSELYNKF